MPHRKLTPERLKAKLEHRMRVLAYCEEQERLLKEQQELAKEMQTYRPLTDQEQMLARLEERERLMKKERETLAREIQNKKDRKIPKLFSCE